MSNVIPLFKEEDRAPLPGTGRLTDVMQDFERFAASQGTNVHSTKFLYDCATIMTLMQIAIDNKE